MALVSAVVNRALRLLKAIDPTAATPPVDHQTAVVALNAMVARWEANGLALGWSPVSAPDDTLPAPEEAEDALAYCLAVALGPEYPEPSGWAEIKERARIGLAELRRDRLTEMPLRQSSDLPPSCGGWNITTDEPSR